jgi:hypothetical protein
VAMMPTGSGMPWKSKASSPASRLEIAQRAGQIRQASLPAPQPHRDDVRPSEELAPRRHSLRSQPNRVLLCRRTRGHRHLLAMTNAS